MINKYPKPEKVLMFFKLKKIFIRVKINIDFKVKFKTTIEKKQELDIIT